MTPSELQNTLNQKRAEKANVDNMMAAVDGKISRLESARREMGLLAADAAGLKLETANESDTSAYWKGGLCSGCAGETAGCGHAQGNYTSATGRNIEAIGREVARLENERCNLSARGRDLANGIEILSKQILSYGH